MENSEYIVIFGDESVIIYSEGNPEEILQNITEKKKRQQRKKRKNVDFFVFNEMLKLDKVQKNIFWKNQLQMYFNGNLPKNFSYDGNILKYNSRTNRKNNFIKLFDNNIDFNANEAFENLKNFLSNYDIRSQHERDIEENDNNDVIEDTDYSDINTYKSLKKRQDIAINQYIKEEIIKYNLSSQEGNNLKSMIIFGLSSKIINDNNIQVENGKIVNIDNLIKDDNNNFELKIDSITNKTKRSIRRNNNDYTKMSKTTLTKNNSDKKSNVDLSKLTYFYFNNLVNKL